MTVVRPVVRSFRVPYLQQAAAWVRAGGHAVVWLAPRKARLVFSRPADDDDFDLGWWSVLDMGLLEYRFARKDTTFGGMAYVRIPHDCYAIVHDRIVRDSIYPDATRTIELDCLECGACCKDNVVELDEEDIERFDEGGRPELARPPYARKRNGVVTLVLRKDKRCQHLGGDNKCGIYALRPYSCSRFPVGSECCLSSREEEMGIVDGPTR